MKKSLLVLYSALFLLLGAVANANVELVDFSGTFVEGFELSFSTYGWGAANPWAVTLADSYAGAKSAQMLNGGLPQKHLTLGVNTSQYFNITLSYYKKLVSAPTQLQASYNTGSGWVVLETVNSSPQWSFAQFSLPDSASENQNFQIRFSCTGNNVSAGCYLDNVIVTGALNDTSPPTYSNLVEPSDPSNYAPNGTFTFQIDWADNVDVTNVSLEFAGTNISASSSGSTWSSSVGPLAVGTYQYKWHGSDDGNSNSTPILTFTVVQAPTTTQLFLQGNESDATIEWLSPVNVTGITNIGSIVLERNGTAVSNPDTSVLNVGSYGYRAYNNGNANYSSSTSPTRILTVVDTTPPGDVTGLAATSISNESITWQWSNPSDADFSHIDIYLNGVYKTNTSGNSYQATGLTPVSNYTITLYGFDVRGNNRMVGNNTAQTSLLASSSSDSDASTSASYSSGWGWKFINERKSQSTGQGSPRLEAAASDGSSQVIPSSSLRQSETSLQEGRKPLPEALALVTAEKNIDFGIALWPLLIIFLLISGLLGYREYLKRRKDDSPLAGWNPKYKG